jgi:3-oxoacyl-[acyl-carrier protein] reductase
LNLGISGRTYLITAASKGLGFSVARELLREGARVMISSSNEANLQAAAGRLRSENLTGVETVVCDLKQAGQIDCLMDMTFEKFGHLDGLVTNCGGPPAGPPLAITDAQWQAAFDSVFMSVVRLCRRIVPHMIERRDGAILAMTSTTVKQPIVNLTTSNSIRPGLVGYLRCLANEVAPHNVRVNVVAPGRILTDRTIELDTAYAARTGMSMDEVRAHYTAEIPMGRLGDLDEFPALCTFLLSPRASYITAQTYCIDGGRVQSLW